MSLTNEYKRHPLWRSWEGYLDALPLTKKDLVLDLGCSIGTVSKLLASRVDKVIGIDNNTDLLKEASVFNSDPKINYLHWNLNDLDSALIPEADGIWCSFVAAYFPDFSPVLRSWQKVLKPGGWIAMIEMSGLYDHEPISDTTANIFKDYYLQQRHHNVYDFEMGTRLKSFLESSGFKIIHEEDKPDAELSFAGAASPTIIEAWQNRFDRMIKFREHTGEELFQQIRQEFINCLKNKNHISKTLVKYLIAIKQ